MIVVDASVLANIVGDDEAMGEAARVRAAAEGVIAIPDLADIETVSVLRRRWQAGDIPEARFRSAVEDLVALRIVRFPARPLMLRAFELRHNLTPYDACHIALAEELACPLLTLDARLSRAPGLNCVVEVLSD